MANYKESSIAGTKWQRCYRLIVNNPYVGNKTINFLEEEIVDIDGTYINTQKEGIGLVFTDPSVVVNLIDPVTGTPLDSTVTYGEIYAILHSLYIQLANERDNPPPSPPPE